MIKIFLLSLFLVGCTRDPRIIEADRKENERYAQQLEHLHYTSSSEGSAQSRSSKKGVKLKFKLI